MGQLPQTLQETRLWRLYEGTVSKERQVWTQKAYRMAAETLKSARDAFPNYTLHDERHILNVLHAMGGILGTWAEKLSADELELLILSANLHDVGMTFPDDEKARVYGNRNQYEDFLRHNCPEYLGTPPEGWPDNLQQNYLRSLHALRVGEVLNRREEWREIFKERPADAVPKETVVAVCKAHGQTPEELLQERRLKPAHGVDPLFCALLLRLSDLLDFDGTRAPDVLYRYALNNEISRKEWDKHRASEGFDYPDAPSQNLLPYGAECKNPNVEHAIRDFLDWVDTELGICHSLQSHCGETGRNFPFPWKVERKDIRSDGYESGDFRLTMNQEKILELLTGKNLYQDSGVFVRELLQNAVDATLLRERMERDFSADSDAARIDMWEWADSDGNLWFRMDDRGTGMTKGMLTRYFLQAGNSYYTSDELKRDLKEHDTDKYTGISRFGIGLLSCFLCGQSAEVSTLYFDREKNKRENAALASDYATSYGLRLQVTGLSGYYTLHNQASEHYEERNLLTPESAKADILNGLEWDGYRNEPGTSILICIDPGKLGAIDLKKEAQRWISCPKMPIYYNGERIGQTYQEMINEVHRCAGTHTFELNDEQKREFDDKFQEFPELKGNYPTFPLCVIPLDAPEYPVLDSLSGALVKVQPLFKKEITFKNCDFHVKFQKNHLVAVLKYQTENINTSNSMDVTFSSDSIPIIDTLSICPLMFCYNGMMSGPFTMEWNSTLSDSRFLIALEGPWKPMVDMGRGQILGVQLEIVLYTHAVAQDIDCYQYIQFANIPIIQWTLPKYRAIRKQALGEWIEHSFKERMEYNCSHMEEFLEEAQHTHSFSSYGVLEDKPLRAYPKIS